MVMLLIKERVNITTLKYKRLTKGLTQEELAKITKISVMSYYRYETGERIPDVRTAQRLATALNTTVEALFPFPNDDSGLQKNNNTKKEEL